MTLNVNQHFVDRGPERALFAGMLAGEHPARVLRVLVPAGHGKSWLVKRLFLDCEERRVPVVWLDFDARQHSRSADAHYVVERFLERLGERRLPRTAALAADWRRAVPSLETDARFLPALGRALQDDLAGWEDAPVIAVADEFTPYERGVAKLLACLGETHPRYMEAVTYQTRLSENITGARWHGDTPDLKAERSRIVAQLNRLTMEVWNIPFDALHTAPTAPAAATVRSPIAVLLDTFEQIPDTARDWLVDWLFNGLRGALGHVRVVVAGRPEPSCCAFFERADLWGHLVAGIDHFVPMPEEAVLDYYRRRGCSFGDLHPATIFQLACTHAGRMASIGDGLLQRGGA